MKKVLTKLHVGIEGDVAGLAKSLHHGLDLVHSFATRIMHAMEIGAAFEVGRQAMEGLEEAIKGGFATASHIEDTEAALTGLAGSAGIAKDMVEDLKKVASTPPFGFDEVAAASKKLLSAGVASDKIIGIIENLGDVSVGTSASLESLTEIFARAATTGSVGTRELNEAARMGTPIVQALADEYHTNQAGVEAMAAAGTLSFDNLTAAFQRMSDKGGRFAGLAASQAKTVGGEYQRLDATAKFAFADIAQKAEDAFGISGGLAALADAVPRVETFFENAVDMVTPYVNGIAKAVEGAATDAYNWTVRNWDGIATVTGDVVSTIYNNLSAEFTAISGIVGDVWDDISAMWTGGANGASIATDTMGKNIAGSFGDLAKNVLDWLNLMSAELANWGSKATEMMAHVQSSVAHLKEEMFGGQSLNQENEHRKLLRRQTVLRHEHVGADHVFANGETEKIFDQISADYAKKNKGLANPYDAMRPTTVSPLANAATAADAAWKQTAEQHAKDVQKTMNDQEEAHRKIQKIIDDFMKNGFKAKADDGAASRALADALGAGITHPLMFKPELTTDNLDLKITPKIESPKLLRYGSGEQQLATYSHSSVTGFGGAMPVAVPIAAQSPRGVAAAGGSDPLSTIAADIRILRQYMVKWDTNPPLGEASF